LDRAATAEQAVSPGHESFGAAALGMIYFLWIVGTAVLGLVFLVTDVPPGPSHGLRSTLRD